MVQLKKNSMHSHIDDKYFDNLILFMEINLLTNGWPSFFYIDLQKITVV